MKPLHPKRCTWFIKPQKFDGSQVTSIITLCHCRNCNKFKNFRLRQLPLRYSGQRNCCYIKTFSFQWDLRFITNTRSINTIMFVKSSSQKNNVVKKLSFKLIIPKLQESDRHVTDKYRRSTDKYWRLQISHRQLQTSQIRITDGYRQVTDKSRTTTDKSQTSHRPLRQIILNFFCNSFIKHYF